MIRLIGRTLATTALLATLAAPLPLMLAPPAAAQLATPVLENGGAGDGTTKPTVRTLTLPIILAIMILGGGFGLVAVTILRRWDRERYPDNHMNHEAYPDDRVGHDPKHPQARH